MRIPVPSSWRGTPRPGRLVTVVWFLVVIGAPLAAFAAGARPAPVENRTTVPAPDVRMDRVLDARWYEELGNWFEDRLPGRDHAVEADAWIDYRVFGDSPNPRVSLGADGWLFLRDAVRAPCLTPERVDEVADELRLVAGIGAAAGVEVVLVVAPDKAAVYPDRLGGLAEEAACSASNRVLLRAALADVPAFADTWSALEAARGTSGALLYHRTDTHWTRYGASVAAAAVVERVSPDLWDPAAVVPAGTQQRRGDLVSLMGLSFREEATVHRVWRGAGVEAARVPLDGGPEAVVSEMTALPAVPGRAVIVHDSMGEVIVPLLRPYFEHLTSVRTRAGSSFGLDGEWFADLLGDADLLLLQTVERDLAARFDGTVARRLAAVLAERLPHVEVTVGDGPAVTADLPGDARFVVVVGGGAATLTAGGVTLDAPAVDGTAVLDVTGLAGPAIVRAETRPARVLVVTLP